MRGCIENDVDLVSLGHELGIAISQLTLSIGVPDALLIGSLHQLRAPTHKRLMWSEPFRAFLPRPAPGALHPALSLQFARPRRSHDPVERPVTSAARREAPVPQGRPVALLEERKGSCQPHR